MLYLNFDLHAAAAMLYLNLDLHVAAATAAAAAATAA